METAPAAVPKAAKKIKFNGGAVLGNVQLVPVFWGSFWKQADGADIADQIVAFCDFILTSSMMLLLNEFSTSSTSIGTGRMQSPRVISSEPGDRANGGRKVSDGQIIDMLRSAIASGTLPATTADTLYFVYLPPGVQSTIFNFLSFFHDKSCVDYCGYHSIDSDDLFYGVLPFPSCVKCGAGAVVDSITVSTSHELCEAVTDPAFDAWQNGNDHEIADECGFPARLGDFLVGEVFSNARSACAINIPQPNWAHADITQLAGAPPATGGRCVGYGWRDFKQIAYLTGDGHIHELFVSLSGGWQHADLTVLANAPVAAGSALVGYGWGDFKQVVYLTADGHIHELFASVSAGWRHADLTAMTNAPAAAGNTLVAYAWGDFKQVVYLTADDHIHELFASLSVGWQHTDLTAATGAPVAVGTFLTGYAWGGFKQVAYQAQYRAGGESPQQLGIYELFASASASWTYANLSSSVGQAAAGTPLVGYGAPGSKQVTFVAANRIQELSATLANGWKHTDLSVTSLAPWPSGTAVSGYAWGAFRQTLFLTSNGHLHEILASVQSSPTHVDLTATAAAPAATGSDFMGYKWGAFKQAIYLTGDNHIHELFVRG